MHKSTLLSRGLVLLTLLVGFTACFDDLDTVPLDDDIRTADVVYDSPAAYEQVLAKLYAGLSVSGQQGPAGQPDIAGIDEGFSTYLRQYFKAQELPTDEAVIAWNDGNIHDYEDQDWTASNEFITAMYNRIFYQIALSNEFIRESSSEKLSARGQTGSVAEQVTTFRAEARFLRALSYYHALDLFRNVPFVTEEDAVGAFFPEQIQAGELFSYIEAELLEIEPLMMDARTNEYGRADKAAVWMLLSKLYLNADAYGSGERYNDVVTYTQKVIDAGFQLEPDYANLYVADNNLSPEVIFPIQFDGNFTRTWGGMTFITHASVGGSMDPAAFGLDGGWGGLRTTSALVNKFPSVGGGGIVVRTPVDMDTDSPTLNVPGAYQGWDPMRDSTVLVALNPDEPRVFTGFIYFAEGLDSYEFKFAEGSWDNAYGPGENNTLVAGGDGNLSVPEAGMYRAEVNLDALTYNIYKVEFGIIGSATLGGWDADQDMTFNPEVGAFEITTPLSAGDEFKFRANDAWDLDFGDNGNDGTLERGGGNIPNVNAGTYRIRLFLTSSKAYTYSVDVPASDSRAMFFTDGQTLEINDVFEFTQGYAVTKFKNVTRDGVTGSDLTFPDTDFMLFRLADAYLMYAEAVLRGGNGDRDLGLEYINRLRQRAYGNESGNVQRSDFDLDFILDERARELYWEGHRRTDLVRFGQFTDGDYVWPLKGGVPEGAPVPAFRNVYPIPAADLGANPNLMQNDGYN